MTLPAFARKLGISDQTARKWFHQGRIPYRTQQFPSGMIIVYEDEPIEVPMRAGIKPKIKAPETPEDGK